MSKGKRFQQGQDHHLLRRALATLAVAAGVCVLAPACEVPTEETESEPSESSADDLSACDIKHRTQHDGSSYAGSNCGMTSAAMFRAVTTCGQCKPSGAAVRKFYMQEHYDGVDTHKGSNTLKLHELLEGFAKYDDCPNYAVTYKRWSEAAFKTKISNGFSAVVHGRNDHNPRRCSTFGNAAWMDAHPGEVPGHSIFVHEMRSGKFVVYDPDCKNDGSDAPLLDGTNRHAGRLWTADELEHYSHGFGGSGTGILASVGRGVLDDTADQPPSSDSGDVGDYGNEKYWGTIRYPDLDGDGVSDICGRASGGLFCGLSTPAVSRFSSPGYWTDGFSDAKGWDDPKYYETIQYADVNGDGKDDVCGRGSAGMRCALSTGSSFGPATLWGHFSDDGSWGDHDYYYATIRLVDVDGDGKADLCGRGSAGISCAKSTGASFGGLSLYTSTFSNDSSWNGRASYWKTIQFGDVNGDGKADVCGRAAAGMICELSSGSAFGNRINTTMFSNAGGWDAHDYYWETIRLVDVTGDGKADICGRGAAGITCAPSLGSSIGSSKLWTSSFSNENNWNDEDSRWKTIQFGDLNADGKMDVCGRGAGGVSCGLSSGSAFAVSKWTTSYSDDGNWDSHPSYWGTLRIVKSMDGFAGDDLCGRAANGIYCAGSSGTSFYPPDFWTTSYSNASGWK